MTCKGWQHSSAPSTMNDNYNSNSKSGKDLSGNVYRVDTREVSEDDVNFFPVSPDAACWGRELSGCRTGAPLLSVRRGVLGRPTLDSTDRRGWLGGESRVLVLFLKDESQRLDLD
jgi:hypothetical protein